MAEKKTTLSSRDLQVIAMAFKSLKSDPQIDYAKLAELAKFKNPGTASACWGPVKKRLMAYAAEAGDDSTPTSTPNSKASSNANGNGKGATPKKRRTKAAAEGDAPEGTPKKRGRAAQKAAAAKHVESEVEDDDDEEVVVGGAGVKEEEGDGRDAADQVLDGMNEYLKAEEVDF